MGRFQTEKLYRSHGHQKQQHALLSAAGKTYRLQLYAMLTPFLQNPDPHVAKYWRSLQRM